MKKMLLFSGTTEGKAVADTLSTQYEITVSVATPYGVTCMGAQAVCGRLEETHMRDWIASAEFTVVVDATHPYAVRVSENVRNACAALGTPYIRIVREHSALSERSDDFLYVESMEHTVPIIRRFLTASERNVLLTTGSNRLDVFTAIQDFEKRLFPRILPTVASIARAESLGYSARNIIAMQGPFSHALNRALMQQYNIGLLVSKDSGATGGFPEKLSAAKEVGIPTILIARPQESGRTLSEAITYLEGIS